MIPLIHPTAYDFEEERLYFSDEIDYIDTYFINYLRSSIIVGTLAIMHRVCSLESCYRDITIVFFVVFSLAQA